MNFVLLVIGFVLVLKGADWLVDGASTLAKKLNVSDLVIGLTVVSFGTSAPELAINIFASANDNTELAIGNVLGSNLFNILVILGSAAIIAPMTVRNNTIFKEIPFSLLAAVVLGFTANDIFLDGAGEAVISRSDGLVLLSFFCIFLYYSFVIAKDSTSDDVNIIVDVPVWKSGGMTLIGLVAIVGGGKLLVDSAVDIARSWGVSESVIGLTILAVGSSLPELVTSIVAARKNMADIVIGNVVGSNIFNIFLVLGTSATIKPLPFQESSNVDEAMVVVMTIILFFFIYNHKENQVTRVHGIIFILIYMIYLAYLLMYKA
jgi:cation:H+ antiporter